MGAKMIILSIDNDPATRAIFNFFNRFGRCKDFFLRIANYIKGKTILLYVVYPAIFIINTRLKYITRSFLKLTDKSIKKFKESPNKDTYWNLCNTKENILLLLNRTEKYMGRDVEIMPYPMRSVEKRFQDFHNNLLKKKRNIEFNVKKYTSPTTSDLVESISSDEIWANRPKCYTFEY